jgi:hypothetical protein
LAFRSLDRHSILNSNDGTSWAKRESFIATVNGDNGVAATIQSIRESQLSFV